jgi:hypothetical protein
MPGGCTCPIHYQVVVSVEKGGMIVRYKSAELIKTVSKEENPALTPPCFKHDYGGGVEPCSPATMFQA